MTALRRLVAVGMVAVILTLATPTPVQAYDEYWCNYWVGRYAYYEHQYNLWMSYYYASWDDFYLNVAQLYYEQMQNASEATHYWCGAGPTLP